MQPKTPEARRAAQKLFNGFMILVAINIIIFAVIMWPRGEAPKVPNATAPGPVVYVDKTGDPATGEMLGVFLVAFDAWTKGNAGAFYAQFAAKYVPADSAGVFAKVFAGVYAEEFGKLGEMKLISRESSNDRDYGMLVFSIASEKVPTAKLSANFLRENGVLKLAQMRLEKP